MSKLKPSRKRPILVAALMGTAAMLLNTGSTIISGDQESSPLPGIGLLYVEESSDLPGTGVVISPSHVLTAKHVVNKPGVHVSAYKFHVQGGTPQTPIAIHKHPTQDLAVVEFNEVFTTAYGLYEDDDELGKQITVAGFGRAGVQVQTQCVWYHDPNSYGAQRWGKNTVSVADSVELIFDFDGNSIDFYQDGGPISGECGIAGGDSGGPSFIAVNGEKLVAGIHWSAYHDGCNANYGYGARGRDIRVSQFVGWIEDQMQ